MNKGPARLGKVEDNGYPYNYLLDRVEEWCYTHSTLCLIILLCILLVSLDGRLPEHPTYVEYKGKLKYSFVRFEKQSAEDFANTIAKIKEIKETS